MPTYDYQCLSCNMKLEVWQSIHDNPLTLHEECGGELKRIISAPMINMRQGKSERVHTDTNGSYIEKHWDGRQDAHVMAQPVAMQSETKESQ